MPSNYGRDMQIVRSGLCKDERIGKVKRICKKEIVKAFIECTPKSNRIKPGERHGPQFGIGGRRGARLLRAVRPPLSKKSGKCSRRNA